MRAMPHATDTEEAHALQLADQLAHTHSLSPAHYEQLIAHRTPQVAQRLAAHAVRQRVAVYGHSVFTRGLIEFTNHCKNDCLYCGIRASNTACQRYRLTPGQILQCCEQGHQLGMRTFVLQGGEDPHYSDDELCALVAAIKDKHPDCAVTLSLGERTRASYEALHSAGADRYLLRHETASPAHYRQLHPATMSFENRMRCLAELRAVGYQVGAGFMVGTPFQTPRELAADLAFIERFKPDMCGIGPFVPHHATPFAHYPGGTVELTCFLLSVIRLIHPTVLLPATTALGTIDPFGREKGILSGANVVMPNLSPVEVRGKYELYDNKICTGDEAAECRNCLQARMRRIGYEIVVDRGDIRHLQAP